MLFHYVFFDFLDFLDSFARVPGGREARHGSGQVKARPARPVACPPELLVGNEGKWKKSTCLGRELVRQAADSADLLSNTHNKLWLHACRVWAPPHAAKTTFRVSSHVSLFGPSTEGLNFHP